MAPEIISNQIYCAYKADIWSAGVILFECLFGHCPFEEEEIANLMKKITACSYVIPNTVSNSVKGKYFYLLLIFLRFTEIVIAPKC